MIKFDRFVLLLKAYKMEPNLLFSFMGEQRNRKFLAGTITELVSRNLTKAKDLAGLTQSEIAALSGVQQRTVGRYLNGEQAISVEILAAIAKAFNLETWQLLVPDFDPSNPPIIRARTKAEAEFERKIRDAYASLKTSQ